jgi:hypothetical protein
MGGEDKQVGGSSAKSEVGKAIFTFHKSDFLSDRWKTTDAFMGSKIK